MTRRNEVFHLDFNQDQGRVNPVYILKFLFWVIVLWKMVNGEFCLDCRRAYDKSANLYSLLPYVRRHLKIGLIVFVSFTFSRSSFPKQNNSTWNELNAFVIGATEFVQELKMWLFLSWLIGCFGCTMEGEFRIYNVEPLSEKARVGKF